LLLETVVVVGRARREGRARCDGHGQRTEEDGGGERGRERERERERGKGREGGRRMRRWIR
jgi:hypothetical protein